jgi:3-oxoacyl-[acyl-carrier-protein] synthase-3
MARYAAISGWGMAVPERLLTNTQLEQMIDTSDEWIRTRTGIAERHIAGPGEHTSVLGSRAGRLAMERAGLSPDAIDLVVVATCTPDRPFPATASAIQAQLEIPNAGAFDVVAACSGFVYGLSVATNMIRGGEHRTVLLIAADLFSHILNWDDRNTCVLFGDGAGAVVLQASDEPCGMLASVIGSQGENEDLMTVEAGGTRLPLTHELLDQRRNCFFMNGREVFKHAVREMCESSLQAIDRAGLTIDDIHLVVPHQANMRIIDALAKRMELPRERVFANIERYGNTSAASIPIALYEAAEQGKLREGDNVLLTAFGGGLAWASTVIRWGRCGTA